MESIPLRLSTYCRLVTLADAHPDAYLAYSGIRGRVLVVDRVVADVLAAAERRSDRMLESAALPERILARLYAARIIVEPSLDEAQIVQKLETVITAIRSGVQQFTILPDIDDLTSGELVYRAERLFNAVTACLRNDPPEQAYVHFWYFDERQLAPLRVLLETYSRWLDANASSLPPFTTTLNTSGLLPLAFDAYPALRRTKTLYCVFTDELLEREFSSLDAYVNQVAYSMLAAGEVGIISFLHFNVHKGNAEIYLKDAFEYFMMAGVFYTLITTFNVIPVHPRRDREELYCALHGHDSNLTIDLRRLMSTSERYRLFTLCGGVNTKLDSCVQRKADAILPDISACPILTNGLVLALSGGIWTCPLLALKGHTGTEGKIGIFTPSFNIARDELNRWRARLSSRIAACSDCLDCLLCGGGCPYDALASGKALYESVCPPISELIVNAVRYNLDAFEHLRVENSEAVAG